MKKLLCIIALILLTGVLAACSQAPEEDPPITLEEPTPTPESTPEPDEADDNLEEEDYDGYTEEYEEAEPLTVTPPDGLSDDLFSFMFSLNGDIYALPFPFTEIEANGWEWDNPQDIPLNPNQRGVSKLMRYGDNTFHLSTVNTSQDVVMSHYSDVGVINLDRFDAQRGAELIFPGGITVGTPYEDVIAIHGEPSERRPYAENAMTRSLVYSVGAYANVTIAIEIETGLVFSLRMENVFAREALPAFEGDLPDSVLAYLPPESLGDNWGSLSIRLVDDMYTIPAPVVVFVENGWVIESDPNEMVPAQTTVSNVQLRYGNQVMRVSIRNYEDTAQPISHTHVTRVEFSRHFAVVPTELPGGITENSTSEDVHAAFGEPDDISEIHNFRTYTFGRIWREVIITFLIDSGEIHSIVVSHQPGDL